MNKNNKTGFPGVYFDVKGKKYRAQINFYGKKIRLGTFQTKEEAYKARLDAQERYNLENYKKQPIDLAIAHFVLQQLLGYNPQKDSATYDLLYNCFAMPSLLYAFSLKEDFETNFVNEAIQQVYDDVSHRVSRHQVYNPLKEQFQYEKSEIMILTDYLSGVPLPKIAKRYSYSYSTAFRKIQGFQTEMKRKLYKTLEKEKMMS